MSGAVLLISAGSATAPSGGLPGMVAAICNMAILLGFIVYMVVDVVRMERSMGRRTPKRPTPEQVAERAKEQLFTKLLTEAAQERRGK